MWAASSCTPRFDLPESAVERIAQTEQPTPVVTIRHRDYNLTALQSGQLAFSSYCSDYFVLCPTTPGTCTFRHLRTARYLTVLKDHRVRLTDQLSSATLLKCFFDKFGHVVIQTLSGLSLEADQEGLLHATDDCLIHRKNQKLFELVETTVSWVPSYPLPVAIHLRTLCGRYVSTAGGNVAATAQVPCCSETLLWDVFPFSACTGSERGGVSCNSTLWTPDGQQLISCEANGKLRVTGQHRCTGQEVMRLTADGQRLQWEVVSGQQETAAGEEVTVCCAVQLEGSTGTLRAGAGKPTRFVLELVSHRPLALISAHGTAIAAQSPPTSRNGSVSASLIDPGAPCSAGGRWVLQQHGDDVYSIVAVQPTTDDAAHTHGCLIVDDAGAVMITNNPEMAFPAEHGLFRIKLRSAFLDYPHWCDTLPHKRQRRVRVTGFTIQTYRKVGGQRLYLSAKPSGAITTHCGRITRWEMFLPADIAAVEGQMGGCMDMAQEGGPDEWGAEVSTLGAITGLRNPLWGVDSYQQLDTSRTLHAIRRVASSSAFVQTPRSLSALSLSEFSEREPWEPATKRGPTRLAECGCDVGGGVQGWGVMSAAPLSHICASIIAHNALMDGQTSSSMGQQLSGAGIPSEVAASICGLMDTLTRAPAVSKWSCLDVEGQHSSHSGTEQVLQQAYYCSECCSPGGPLLVMAPHINPLHHDYLDTMRRQHYGRRPGAHLAHQPAHFISVVVPAMVAFVFPLMAGRVLRRISYNKQHQKSGGM